MVFVIQDFYSGKHCVHHYNRQFSLHKTHRIMLITRLLCRKSHEGGNWKGYLPFPSLPLQAVTLGGQLAAPLPHSLLLGFLPALGVIWSLSWALCQQSSPSPTRGAASWASKSKEVRIVPKRQPERFPKSNDSCMCGTFFLGSIQQYVEMFIWSGLVARVRSPEELGCVSRSKPRTKLRVQHPVALMGTLSERVPKCFISSLQKSLTNYCYQFPGH